ncbi:MAG: hypothetical protein EOO89_21915 [Pedobacter sp.]|nr:MAG: hypothetical protein EOO89_21915 [Pedobacter sp.]
MGVEREITGYPVNQLPIQATDLFLGVRDLSGIPTTVTFTYGSLFGNVNVPVNFRAPVIANTVTTNSLTLNNYLTPPSSNSNLLAVGAFCYDDKYIYVGVANNHIMRAPLQDF